MKFAIRPICLQKLEERNLLTSVQFEELTLHRPLDLTTTEAAVFFDFDFDGDLDISFHTDIYENEDGQFNRTLLPITSILGFGDFDNDGDKDIVAKTETTLSWIKNQQGQLDFENPIPLPLEETVFKVDAIDLDHDGYLDLIPRSNDKFHESPNRNLTWLPNQGGSGFSREQIIATDFNFNVSADLNGDDLPDIIATRVNSTKHPTVHELFWFANNGPNGFSEPVFLSSKSNFSYGNERTAQIGDIDNDGDIDILWGLRHVVEPSQMSIPNLLINDNSGQFTANSDIGSCSSRDNASYASLLADLDNDGNLDIAFLAEREDHHFAHWELNACRNNGTGKLDSQILVDSFGYDNANYFWQHGLFAVDVDSNGVNELLRLEKDFVRSHTFTDFAFHYDEIFALEPAIRQTVAPDITGITDVLPVSISISPGRILLVADGKLQFPVDVIDNVKFESLEIEVTWLTSIATADINSDGLDDLLLFGKNNHWIEGTARGLDLARTHNLDQILSSNTTATDFDADGDIDLVTIAPFGGGTFGGIYWLENRDGQGNFSRRFFGAPCLDLRSRTTDFTVGDLDGDLDQDVFLSCRGHDKTILLENNNGIAGEQEEHNFYLPDDIQDIDNDGDLDFLAEPLFAPSRFPFAWYENGVGGRLRFKRHFLENRGRLFDIDADGDFDIDTGRGWFFNEDGKGTFSPLTPGDCLCGASFDFDGDGDADSIRGGGGNWLSLRINLTEPSKPFGDANFDGVFDSADLIHVLGFGEYEDDIDNNSTFEEGDWNGDGEFDSRDLVDAFQQGEFLNSAKIVFENKPF